MALSPEQFALLRKLFDEAVGMLSSEREVLIEDVRRSAGNQMAEALSDLLKAHDQPTDTMDQPFLPPQIADLEETLAFREDELILGRFRIVRLLGRGGMGEVYEAEDQELGPVALKTIRHKLLGDRSALRRFRQEVHVARQVASPHVCRVYELFVLPDDGQRGVTAFLTMELLDGTTLAKRIEQGPLLWSEAEPVAIDLCRGLEALHTAGLVHRDFKPANAMLVRRGNTTQAVVMDLGLALRPEDSLHGLPKLTLTGGIVGTPGYMAPEQLEGTKVSAATDIYALGLVLYEMTTGKRPFEASTPWAAALSRAKKPPKASSMQPGLPRFVDQVIEKCLELEPADRFNSAEAVAKELRARVPSRSRGLLGGFEARSFDVLPSRLMSRRAVLYWTSAALAAGGATTWFWSDFEEWRHPLPARRFVAAMMWPKVTDQQSVSLLSQSLSTISRELARAEAFDKQFLILDSGTSARDYAPATPVEAAGILGANLVLAASVLMVSRRIEIALSVLDPASSRTLRRESVTGSFATLPQRAAATAARLLGVRLGPLSTKASDEFSDVPAAGYQLFLSGQEQMGRPNNEGLDLAIEKYQAALREDPRFAAAYAALAMAYARRFAFQGNQSDLMLASRNSKLALEYGPALSRAQFSQALIKLYSGDSEEALRIFRELLKADPGDEELLMYEAQAFGEMNKTELEERVYQNLLGQRPNYWPAYNDLGLVHRGKGEYREAAKYFLQATAIAPGAAIPWTNLGAAYFLLGNMDDARRACQRAIANHPNEDAFVILGDIAYSSHQYRKALDLYEQARDINRNQHPIWRDIGDCYAILRQPAQAERSYKKAAEILAANLQINPRSGRDWMTLAYYSAKLADRSQAAAELAEAEKRGAPDFQSQIEKAQILVLLGQKDKGISLVLDLLKRGMSPEYVNLAVDLQGALGDPRLRAALAKAQ